MRRAYFQFVDETGDTINVAVDHIVSYGYHVEKNQTFITTSEDTTYCIKNVSQATITEWLVDLGSEHHIL